MENSLALPHAGRGYREPAGPIRICDFTFWRNRKLRAFLDQTKGRLGLHGIPFSHLPPWPVPNSGFYVVLSPFAYAKCETLGERLGSGLCSCNPEVGQIKSAHGLWRQNFLGFTPYLATSGQRDRGEVLISQSVLAR